jgi:pimeloyl-ACP methyl ester carboxylesterase
VSGGHGHFTDEHGTELVDRALDAELVTVPDAGHDIHLEKPEELSSLILSFLNVSRDIRHEPGGL